MYAKSSVTFTPRGETAWRAPIRTCESWRDAVRWNFSPECRPMKMKGFTRAVSKPRPQRSALGVSQLTLRTNQNARGRDGDGDGGIRERGVTDHLAGTTLVTNSDMDLFLGNHTSTLNHWTITPFLNSGESPEFESLSQIMKK